MNEFIKAMTDHQQQPEIMVYFRGCSEPVNYTAAVMALLKSDPDTLTIIDASTGEILFTRL